MRMTKIRSKVRNRLRNSRCACASSLLLFGFYNELAVSSIRLETGVLSAFFFFFLKRVSARELGHKPVSGFRTRVLLFFLLLLFLTRFSTWTWDTVGPVDAFCLSLFLKSQWIMKTFNFFYKIKCFLFLGGLFIKIIAVFTEDMIYGIGNMVRHLKCYY